MFHRSVRYVIKGYVTTCTEQKDLKYCRRTGIELERFIHHRRTCLFESDCGENLFTLETSTKGYFLTFGRLSSKQPCPWPTSKLSQRSVAIGTQCNVDGRWMNNNRCKLINFLFSSCFTNSHVICSSIHYISKQGFVESNRSLDIIHEFSIRTSSKM